MKNSQLTDQEKINLFKQKMGIGEDAGQVHHAGGYHRNPYAKPRNPYYNVAGPSDSRMEDYQNTRTLALTITNTGTATQNAVLFGKDFAPQSGADIQIVPQIGGSFESINNDVASSPLVIHMILFNAETKAQMKNVWELNSANNFGKKESEQFFPQNHVEPSNLTQTLIKTIFPKFTASNKNWISIPVEPGNTITINFWVGDQLSLEGIAQGTHTVE